MPKKIDAATANAVYAAANLPEATYQLERIGDALENLAQKVIQLTDQLSYMASPGHLERQRESFVAAAEEAVSKIMAKMKAEHQAQEATYAKTKAGRVDGNLSREQYHTLLNAAQQATESLPPGTPADQLDITDKGAAALEAAQEDGVLLDSDESSPAIALAMLAPDATVQNASVFDSVATWATHELRGRLGRATAGATWDALSKLPADTATKALAATADLVKIAMAAAVDRHARKRLAKEIEFPLSTLANLLALEVAVIRRTLADVVQLAFGIAAKLATQHLRPVL